MSFLNLKMKITLKTKLKKKTQEKNITGQYPLWTWIQKFLTKY